MSRDDARWDSDRDRDESLDRDRGSRGRSGERLDARERDPRDTFVQQLDLPRGEEREKVRSRNREVELDGSESRALATIGAFRVVQSEDLRACFGADGRAKESARDDLRHLEASGLVREIPLENKERAVVVLTKQGREVLEANRRDGRRDPIQAYYDGLRKPRELNHDSQVYRAFQRAEERLRNDGSQVRRVVLDYELKREYQCFLQERNRGRADSDGRPDRDEAEIRAWALQHDLPYHDDSVHFPDVRIEYEDRDGRSRHEDLEVVTEHYRGMHASSAARPGFSQYRARSISGGGGKRGGRGSDPRLAEEFLR